MAVMMMRVMRVMMSGAMVWRSVWRRGVWVVVLLVVAVVVVVAAVVVSRVWRVRVMVSCRRRVRVMVR